MVLINAMFFTAEDAEDAEKGFILGKGAVPMQAMKPLTPFDALCLLRAGRVAQG